MDVNVWTSIRSVPEDQAVEGYKQIQNRADCVLYMVANPQLNAWTPMDKMKAGYRRPGRRAARGTADR